MDYGVSYEGKNIPLVRVKSKKNLLKGQYYFDEETGLYSFSDEETETLLIHSNSPYFSEERTFNCSDCGKTVTANRRDNMAWTAFELQKRTESEILDYPLCVDCYSKLGPWIG